MDRDGSGTLDFDEFLFALRPPLNNNRKSLIQKAFRYIKTKCQDRDSNLEPFDSEMLECTEKARCTFKQFLHNLTSNIQ